MKVGMLFIADVKPEIKLLKPFCILAWLPNRKSTNPLNESFRPSKAPTKSFLFRVTKSNNPSINLFKSGKNLSPIRFPIPSRVSLNVSHLDRVVSVTTAALASADISAASFLIASKPSAPVLAIPNKKSVAVVPKAADNNSIASSSDNPLIESCKSLAI